MKRDKPQGEELHRSRVNYYYSPGTFDVDYKPKRDQTEKGPDVIIRMSDIKSSDIMTLYQNIEKEDIRSD